MAFPRLISRRTKWRYPNPQHAPWCADRKCRNDLHWLVRPLALYSYADGLGAAVVTQRGDAPGMSVSNFPEGVMLQLQRDYPDWTLTLIEHTPDTAPILYSKWCGGDHWEFLPLERVAAMTGERV